VKMTELDGSFRRRIGERAVVLAQVMATAPAPRCCSPEAAAAGPTRGSYVTSVVAGLLSSSCCALQLVANSLALGCAGFNKFLGPARPWMRGLSVLWLAVLWVASFRRGWPKRHATISTLVCVGLALLPEMLLLNGGPAMAPSTSNVHSIRLKIDGMGCEACQVHVRSVLDRSAGVVSSDVDFEAGFADLEIADGWGFNLTAIKQRLRRDGYEVLNDTKSVLEIPEDAEEKSSDEIVSRADPLLRSEL